MFKKLAALMTAAILTVSAVGCSTASVSTETKATDSQITITETSASSTSSALSETESGISSESFASSEDNQETSGTSSGTESTSDASSASSSFGVSSDLFTDRDLAQSADLSEAIYLTAADDSLETISAAGVYVISGSASNYTVVVEASDEDKVQIVLDGLTVTNDDSPVIYVKNADKTFITTAEGTDNTLTVSGTFTTDGDTNTDAVIFSKDDLVLNGLGTLTLVSTDNGISCKDDLKITGGTISIDCASDAIEVNNSILMYDGTVTISQSEDGLHAENDEDNTLGSIQILGGTLNITVSDDALHATSCCQIDGGSLNLTGAEGIEATYIEINDGAIQISASDDGINAGQKSTAYQVAVVINGGNITIDMGQGDTDAIDSNGDITINSCTISITAQSPFDYDGTATYNGGTIIVNGVETNEITNQMMGGMGMGGFGGKGGKNF